VATSEAGHQYQPDRRTVIAARPGQFSVPLNTCQEGHNMKIITWPRRLSVRTSASLLAATGLIGAVAITANPAASHSAVRIHQVDLATTPNDTSSTAGTAGSSSLGGNLQNSDSGYLQATDPHDYGDGGFYQSYFADNWSWVSGGGNVTLTLSGHSGAQSSPNADSITLTDTWDIDGIALSCGLGIPSGIQCTGSGATSQATWSTTMTNSGGTTHTWNNMTFPSQVLYDLNESATADFQFGSNDFRSSAYNSVNFWSS
jgi:hypothetical protein